MAKGIQNYPNVTTPDSDYPDGHTIDETGINDGTPVDLMTLGDYQQWFAKVLREAGITPNGLPENEYSGHQYYEGAKKVFNKYGTSQVLTATGSITIPLANGDDELFNPLVIIMPGIGTGVKVFLPLNIPRDLTTVTIVNDSSNSIDIESPWPLDHVIPFPSVAVLTLAAGKSIELTFLVINGQNNWIVSKKP